MVGHNDRGVKRNGERLEEELSEVRMEMTKCVVLVVLVPEQAIKAFVYISL